jgi:hypothetical protein
MTAETGQREGGGTMSTVTLEAEQRLRRITAELARISEQQHALERRRTILREAATRLRLGQSPRVIDRMVRVQMERVGAAMSHGQR